MARNDDYPGEDMDGGYKPDRGRYANTSDFSTTTISDDGRFLGMKLSPQVASQLSTFYPALLTWASKKGENIAIPRAEKFAEKMLGKTGAEARHFGSKTGDVVGYGIILSNQIFNVGRTIYDSVQSLNDLRVAVKPLAKSSGKLSQVAPLSGDNEVVSNARSKINGIFWRSMTQTATSTIGAAPALVIKWNEQGVKNLQRTKLRELESAHGNPEELANLLEKDLAGGGVHAKGSADDMRKALNIMIERRRTAYEADCEAFIAKGLAGKKQELEKALSALSAENLAHGVRTLETHGFDTRYLSRRIDHVLEHNAPDAAKPLLQQAVTEFQTSNRDNIEHCAREGLKTAYVRREGAFDRNWTKYLEDGDSYYNYDKPTIKKQIEADVEKVRDMQQKAQAEAHAQHRDADGNDIGTMAAGLGAGIVAEFATKVLGGKSLEKYRQPIALDRILHLRRVLENVTNNAPEEVPGIGIPGAKSNERDMSYTRYVHEVFQQHRRDCNRSEIGERFTEHFDQAGWKDADITHMADKDLTAYEFAVKTIAKRIKDGRMDAIALIRLVGDKQKKIVQDDGLSFGPRNSRDEDATKKAIHDIIDEQTALLHVTSAKTNEEINDKLGNFVFGLDDLKHALESKEGDPQQRAFIFTVFSDVVGSDEKLCKQLGINAARCKELRNETTQHFDSMLDGAVDVLAEMIEKNPGEIEKKLKLTEKEKGLILSLAGRAKEEGKDITDIAENREEIRSIETVVANAAMSLGNDAEGQGFWQRLMTASRKPKQAPQKTAKPLVRESEAPAMQESETPAVPRDRFASDDILQKAVPLSAIEREAKRRDKDSGVQSLVE
jgi:hypothetical protein